jgi:hypothetical protein
MDHCTLIDKHLMSSTELAQNVFRMPVNSIGLEEEALLG